MQNSAVFCMECDWHGFFGEFAAKDGFRCPFCGHDHFRQVPEADETEEIRMVTVR